MIRSPAARALPIFLLSCAAVGALVACGASDGEAAEVAAVETAPEEAPAPTPTAGDATVRPWIDGPFDRVDAFTYANVDEVRVAHADLDLNVDFAAKTLAGVARLRLDYVDPAARQVLLDTNDLNVERVEASADGETWAATGFVLGADDPTLGSKLTIDLPEGAQEVRISYSTSPDAAGLQWLSPAQTSGDDPYVYSQAQPIHARSMAPLQDTPAVRMTFKARLTTSPDLMAVMAASQDPDGARDGEYFFEMPQPIPPYLLALAVGDIVFEPIADTIGVYAEPSVVDAAAAEFEDAPKMEAAAAALYGPYLWDRYDMIVMPPSFPYGGMENPRLTFLTPTLIAGDKSLTNVVAHEIAHSWSGNLVTNATWRDAWLNEGFTSYVENRIMERLYGEERAAMERLLDLNDLRNDIANAPRPELTRLKMPADLESIDAAFSNVSYVKGMFFLKFLEDRFGREAFDGFLRSYFNDYAFKSVITEDFLSRLEETLRAEDPDAVSDGDILAWVYGPGLPDTAEKPLSDRFAMVDVKRAEWLADDRALEELGADDWTTHEWRRFLNGLPTGEAARAADLDDFGALESAFSLSGHGNAEIAFAWHMKAIAAGYEPADPALEAFLLRVGRGKFIYPLYRALSDAGKRDFALAVYEQARSGYHPIAQARIDAMLGYAPS